MQDKRVLAQSHMSFVKSLNQYNQGQSQFKPVGSPKSLTIDHPAVETANDFDIDMEESAEGTGNHVPVARFHSNHVSRKLVLFNEKGEPIQNY